MRTHKHWFDRLKEVALNSHDPDTQTACTIVAANGWGHADAANWIPHRLQVTPERVRKPAKYEHIEHAEKNAICAAASRSDFSTYNATMYLNWFPCAGCATLIVACGIGELHCDQAAYEARKDDPRYGFALAMEKLTEANVRIVWH